MKHSPAHCRMLLTLAGLLVAPTLAAADVAGKEAPPPAPGTGQKTYGPGYLRPEQLLQCLRDRKQVVALNQQLSADKTVIEQTSAEISTAEAALVAQQTEIDRARQALIAQRAALQNAASELDVHLQRLQDYDRASAEFSRRVKIYNDGVNAQQARREPHNRAVITLNAQLDALRERAAAVDARCAGALSYPEDTRAAHEALAAEEAAQKR